MVNTRPIPIPPPPPATPMPPGGTEAWARWHLAHTFSPDDAAIIEWLCTWPLSCVRHSEFVSACFARQWAGWQATLAWACVVEICEPMDSDIPF